MKRTQSVKNVFGGEVGRRSGGRGGGGGKGKILGDKGLGGKEGNGCQPGKGGQDLSEEKGEDLGGGGGGGKRLRGERGGKDLNKERGEKILGRKRGKIAGEKRP